MLNKFLDENYRMHLKNISLGITTMCIIEEIFFYNKSLLPCFHLMSGFNRHFRLLASRKTK